MLGRRPRLQGPRRPPGHRQQRHLVPAVVHRHHIVPGVGRASPGQVLRGRAQWENVLQRESDFHLVVVGFVKSDYLFGSLLCQVLW